MLKLIFNFILFFLISFSNLALAIDFYEREILNNNPTRWRYIKSPIQPVELQSNQTLTTVEGTIPTQYYTLETVNVTSALTGTTKIYKRYKRTTLKLYKAGVDPISTINNPVDEYINPTDGHNHTSGNTLWPTVNLNLTPTNLHNGSTSLLLTPATHDGVHNDGLGAFRTDCAITHFGNDDPIVYPNQQGKAHHHTFFGNSDTNYLSTPESIRNSGGSSCAGGIANRSAYWIPSVIDTATGAPQKPVRGIIYYKAGGPTGNIQPFPTGLRMIAGNAGAVTEAESSSIFACVNESAVNYQTGLGKFIPACAKSNTGRGWIDGYIRLRIEFPSCWDGVNLDSADHKSHMAYSNGGFQDANGDWYYPPSFCPTTHPIPVPKISEIFDFEVTDATNGTNNWRLSSDNYSTAQRGGLSLHADWMNGWVPSIMQRIVTNCLNQSIDCGVNYLGDGEALGNNP